MGQTERLISFVSRGGGRLNVFYLLTLTVTLILLCCLQVTDAFCLRQPPYLNGVEVVKIGLPADKQRQISTYLAKTIIEEQIQVKVSLVSVTDDQEALSFLETGSIDAYFELYGAESNVTSLVAKNGIIRGGMLGIKERQGWFIPEYSYTADRSLAFWESYQSMTNNVFSGQGTASLSTGVNVANNLDTVLKGSSCTGTATLASCVNALQTAIDSERAAVGTDKVTLGSLIQASLKSGMVNYDTHIISNLNLNIQLSQLTEEQVISAFEAAKSSSSPYLGHLTYPGALFYTPLSGVSPVEVELPSWSYMCSQLPMASYNCSYEEFESQKLFRSSLSNKVQRFIERIEFNDTSRSYVDALIRYNNLQIADASCQWIKENLGYVNSVVEGSSECDDGDDGFSGGILLLAALIPSLALVIVLAILFARYCKKSNAVTDSNDEKDFEIGSGSIQTLQIDDKPITGPIVKLLMGLYYTSIFIVVFAELIGWTPNVRFGALFPVSVLCTFVLEISRLLVANDSFSQAPLYLSIAMFAAVVFISREIHQLLTCVWYAAYISILLQCGSNRLKALFFNLVIFLMVYAVTVAIMNEFYVDETGVDDFTGLVLDVPIRWIEELTFMFALVMLTISFMELQIFITKYSQTLVHHSTENKNLQKINKQLEDQLHTRKDSVQIDLDSPYMKAINALREIEKNAGLDENTRVVMGRIIETLQSSDRIDVPTLGQKVDEETATYLEQAIHVGHAWDAKKEHNYGASQILPSSRKSQQIVLENLVNENDDLYGQENALYYFNIVYENNLNPEAINECLRQHPNWDFDVFKLHEISGEKSLYLLGYHLLELEGLIDFFQIDRIKMRNFLLKIEAGYHNKNPYHNSIHAADVLHSMYYLVSKSKKLAPPEIDEVTLLVAIIAPIIHDFEHPGVNNNFLVNTNDELAVLYNDVSPLENHHSAKAFLLMKETEVLAKLPPETFRQFRSLTVDLVLPTDMGEHFKYYNNFKTRVQSTKFSLADPQDKLLTLQILMKCADANNPAKPFHLSKQWTDRIMDEFFLQGDMERDLGMPVSMFMDKATTDIPKCQVSFISFFVLPMWLEVDNFFQEEHISLCYETIQQNKKYWDARSSKSQSAAKDA
eukprot:Nk52_evm5s2604 gene=Nk52_evmTU5s2604